MANGDIHLQLLYDDGTEPPIPFGPDHPSIGPYTRDLYAAVEPFPERDEAFGWATLRMCHAVGRWFDPVEELVRASDAGPGWSALLDVERCPDWALPYLAQIAGVSLTHGAPTARWRDEIRDHENFHRGTVEAMVLRARRRLTGSRRVTVIERYDEPDHPKNDPPYQILFITYDDETPDAPAVLAEIMGGKPAGLRVFHRVDTGQSWRQVRDGHATWRDVAAAYRSWADVRADLPS